MVDTSDSDYKCQFWFTIDVSVTVSLGLSLAGDQESFLVGVFLGIGGSSLDNIDKISGEIYGILP